LEKRCKYRKISNSFSDKAEINATAEQVPQVNSYSFLNWRKAVVLSPGNLETGRTTIVCRFGRVGGQTYYRR
jgi:hypothetical protein